MLKFILTLFMFNLQIQIIQIILLFKLNQFGFAYVMVSIFEIVSHNLYNFCGVEVNIIIIFINFGFYNV